MRKAALYALLMLGGLPLSAATLELKDKTSVSGTIVSEKSDAIVIDIGGTVRTIPRSQIVLIVEDATAMPLVQNSVGFQPDTTFWTNGAFTLNVAFEDLETIKAQLKGHPDWIFDKDANGENPLLMAVLRGDKDIVKLLLANKANIHTKDNAGQTALHKAAYSNHKDIAELLLANKADVNAKDINGATPLHFAASYGCEEVADVLLANKANVNAKDINGQTPLHLAAEGHEDVAEMKFVNVAKLLLANKANVNAKNNGGATPLFLAALSDYKDVVELLLAHKAEVNSKSKGGQTILYLLARRLPYQVNRETGIVTKDDRSFQGVVDLLRQHGGRE